MALQGRLVGAVFGVSDHKMAIAAATVWSPTQADWILSVEITTFLLRSTSTSTLEQFPILQEADLILSSQTNMYRVLVNNCSSHKVKLFELPATHNAPDFGSGNNREVTRMMKLYAK
jgi:hypothetical protein